MKTKFQINIILAFALLVFSCEDNLEPKVYDQITPENFLKSETDVKTAVTGVYSEFRGVSEWGRYKTSLGSILLMQEMPTDENGTPPSYYTAYTDFMWQLGGYGITEIFDYLIPAVTKATSMIERIRDAKVSDEIKARYIAELRTVRAFWMLDLFDLYGPVPAIVSREEVINPAGQKQVERPTREWYVNFLESELTDIIQSNTLKIEWSKNDYGHVTQGTAMMILLNLYMHEGGYYRTRNEGDPAVWFTKAEKVAADMMNLDYYRLQKPFADIWSPTNQGNKEIVYSLPSFPIPIVGNNFISHVVPTNYVSRQGIAITGWSIIRTPWELYDSFVPDDHRRDVHRTEYWNGKEVVTGRTGDFAWGALTMKYPENPRTDGTNNASEYVIYRYADVILLRSEAKNELYGPDGGGSPTAKDLLNMVRERAFDNYHASTHEAFVNTLTDKNAFRKHLLQERAWELCWEGKRRTDLIRHGEFINNALTRGKNLAKYFHVLYPIPRTAINELKIQNNEGYD